MAKKPSKPRMNPRERDVVDWLAHGFGRAADFARGQRKSITAIEREEASNRLIQERRQRRERVAGFMSAKKGAKVRGA